MYKNMKNMDTHVIDIVEETYSTKKQYIVYSHIEMIYSYKCIFCGDKTILVFNIIHILLVTPIVAVHK